jgi:acyl-coenzyme A synthetase/AMP-(fatty) acid ligase
MTEKRWTTYNIIEEKCRVRPGKTAMIITDREITYRELLERVTGWANYFSELGVKEGHRIMLITHHRFDFIAAWLAVWKLKAVPIPLEPSVNAYELNRAIESGKVHWLLSETGKHKDMIDSPDNYHYNPLNPSWIMARLKVSADIESIPGSGFYTYTSGTTGIPKCVMYDHSAVTAAVCSLIHSYRLSDEDVVHTPLTPALPATMLTGILPILAVGGTLAQLKNPVPGQVLKLIDKTGTTVFFTVPYFYDLLTDALEIRGNSNLENLRLCLSTSAYLSEQTFQKFYHLTGIPIRSIYCTSEAMYCTFNGSQNLEKLSKSVGTPQRDVIIRVIKEGNKESAPGEEGEIIVSGAHLSKGYFCKPELEEKVYKNGWVYTGDLGYLDREGYLYITGRLSDTINVGGHLVNPQEVETILKAYPGVSEAMVIGEKDARIGETVVGKVVTRTDARIGAEDLINFCKKNLMHYKVPHRIDWVDTLPKSRYGKIRRVN